LAWFIARGAPREIREMSGKKRKKNPRKGVRHRERVGKSFLGEKEI